MFWQETQAAILMLLIQSWCQLCRMSVKLFADLLTITPLLGLHLFARYYLHVIMDMLSLHTLYVVSVISRLSVDISDKILLIKRSQSGLLEWYTAGTVWKSTVNVLYKVELFLNPPAQFDVHLECPYIDRNLQESKKKFWSLNTSVLETAIVLLKFLIT